MDRMSVQEQDMEEQFDEKLLSVIESTLIPTIGDPRVGDHVIVSTLPYL